MYPELSRDKETVKKINIIIELCRENNITIQRWLKRSDFSYAWADIPNRKIIIPVPRDDNRFLIALHEIGHCVKGLKKTEFEQEFDAEKYAITMGKKFGISHESLIDYSTDAIKYINGFVTGENNLYYSTPISPRVARIAFLWLESVGTQEEYYNNLISTEINELLTI
jgi:hypothetical protein